MLLLAELGGALPLVISINMALLTELAALFCGS